MEVTGEDRRDVDVEAEGAAGVVPRTEPAPAVRGRPFGLAPVGSFT